VLLVVVVLLGVHVRSSSACRRLGSVDPVATVGAPDIAHKYNPRTCRLRLVQLDLNLLVALDALLDEESVTGAADRLHLSAPAMSRTLGRIRQATGDEILVRSGRTMRPTPRAVALRGEVRSLVLRSREVLAPDAALDLATLHRTFTIRAHDALVSVLAPLLVQRVAAEAPGVALRFLGESTDDTTDLRRGVVDLEIGSAEPTSPEIDHDQVGTDTLVGLARRGHPLVDRGPATAVDVAAWVSTPHVVVSRRGRLQDRVDELLATAGTARTVIAAVASTSAAVEIVRETDAVVVLPASVASRVSVGGDTVAFALPVALPVLPVVVSWHRRFTSDQGHGWLRGLVADATRAGAGRSAAEPSIGD
jgi:DNA-binding transcriptional LysR family regulator